MPEVKKENLDFLRQHQPSLIGLKEARKAAVCIPLIDTEEGYHILFEVRSSDIAMQPGDICFPGGGMKKGETPWETAVREIKEELLIREDQIEQLGLMDVFGGVNGRLYVYPFAILLKGYQNTFSLQEVERVFEVPLSWFVQQEPEVYDVKMEVVIDDDFPYDRIYGGKEYQWRKRREDVLFYQYGEYTIWGMTAKMLHSFVEVYKNR